MADPFHDELSRHAQALRGLARDLLRDAHAAEDVTQRTMQQALATAPRLAPGPLGGWLQRTLRNFSLQWRRSERRRVAREARFVAATGRDGSDPRSPAETLARREMLQAVTDAVLQLDEPYQTVVFLRYFEDLPPRAIARRTGAPVATVKSQLARGLVMLRHRLDARRAHEWRPALAVAFGLPIGTALIPLTGALLVKTSLKLAAAAIVLGGVGAYLYDRHDAPPMPQPAADTTTRDGTASAQADVATDAGADGVERTAIEASADDHAWLDHPYPMAVEVLVLDTTGLPVAGHRPELSPLDGGLRDASVETGADGIAVVHWNARTPRTEIEVLDPRRHRRRVVVQSGTPAHVVMVREPQGDGTRLTFGRMVFNSAQPAAAPPTSLGKPRRSDEMELGLHPFAMFSENGMIVDRGQASTPQEVGEPIQLQSLLGNSTFELTLGTGGKVRITPAGTSAIGEGGFGQLGSDDAQVTAQPARARIEGVVYGEDGKPAANVPVALLGDGPQPLQRGRTDEQGAFAFEDVHPGDVVVRAGGEREGLASNALHVEGGVWRSNVQLRREAFVHGVVRDTAGEPVSGAGLEWQADDGNWADRATTDGQGRFVIANLPPGTGRLFVWPGTNASGFPAAVLPNVFANPGELQVELPPVTHNGFRLVVQAPDGLPGEHQPRVRVRHVETGFSRTMKSPDKQHPTWHLDELPVGDYEVAVWMPGAGALPLGHHWLGLDTVQDLGTVKLPRAARVTFSLPGEAPLPSGLEAEIVQLRADYDVRYEVLRGFGDAVLLPAGDYALLTRIEERAVQMRRFRLTPGATTELPVAW